LLLPPGDRVALTHKFAVSHLYQIFGKKWILGPNWLETCRRDPNTIADLCWEFHESFVTTAATVSS